METYYNPADLAEFGGTEVREASGVEPFADALARHGLSLGRDRVHTLQVSTGYLCNLRCRHCHLEAGPGREEVMSRETMAAVVSFARRFPFQVHDVTGGAPELVPDLPFLIEGLAPLAPRLMLRTNLSALKGAEREKRLPPGAAHGGKVRPKEQPRCERSEPFDEKRKVGHQLGGSASDIEDLDREPPGQRNDRRHRLPGHDLFPVRTGLEVAMPATEIAKVPRAHLEGVDAVPDQGESMTREGVGERLDPGRLPDAGPAERREIGGIVIRLHSGPPVPLR